MELSRDALKLITFGLLNVVFWREAVLPFADNLSDAAWVLVLPLLTAFLTDSPSWFVALSQLLAPLILAGGPRHGRPWLWLIYPPLWPYFLINFGSVCIAFLIAVLLGRALGNFARGTSRH